MPKKLSDTEKLAIWFVQEILGEKFDYRMANHRYQLKAAKDLVNPGPDPVTGEVPMAYAVEEIKGYVVALRDGTSDVADYEPLKINSLRLLTSVSRGKGKSFLALLSVVPDPPPVYEAEQFAKWAREYGAKALKRGEWDGIFPWWPDETPGTCERMSLGELEGIVGQELAQKSLEIWYQAQQKQRRELQ